VPESATCTPVMIIPTPRMVGLDDFSRKRGYYFGTALVDLQTRRLIDLLPERTIAVVAAWLREHSGVEIVARDRKGSYAEGVLTSRAVRCPRAVRPPAQRSPGQCVARGDAVEFLKPKLSR
jgi:transposase